MNYEEVEFSRDQEDQAEDAAEAMHKRYEDCISFIIFYNKEIHGEFDVKEFTKALVQAGDEEWSIRVRRES